MATPTESPAPARIWCKVEDGHPPSAKNVILWFDGDWSVGSWWDHHDGYMAEMPHESYEHVKPTHWMDPGTPDA